MRKHLLFACTASALLAFSPTTNGFYESQLRFPRVKDALRTKGRVVEKLLTENGISASHYDLFIRAFKQEQQLEVWGKNKSDQTYRLLKTYPFCATTGTVGPKRRSGDKQMPEGFYTVNAFNPTSEYYLSFRIDYPNASDNRFVDPINPGSDIYIHGDCITIGCIPIGNENIKEVYLLAAKAKSHGQATPVHIFPARLTSENYAALQNQYAADTTLLEFWSWLKPAYDAFEATQIVPSVHVDEAGRYVVR